MPLVRFYAAARDAAGAREAEVDATTSAELVTELATRFGAPMERVLKVASLLVDGRTVSPGEEVSLPVGAAVDVLPPFAGG